MIINILLKIFQKFKENQKEFKISLDNEIYDVCINGETFKNRIINNKFY